MTTAELPTKESLTPLPANQRWKGLSGIGGGRKTLRNILKYCREGITREDLQRYIQRDNPDLKERSVDHRILVVAREFDCLKLDEDQVFLTNRGRAFLESDDPEQLMDWLVTRILGIDHVLIVLKEEGRCSRSELATRLQRINPGWTSDRIPKVILNELRALEILRVDENRTYSLTDVGKKWAQRIHWVPESLEPRAARPSGNGLKLPNIEEISIEVSKRGHFPVPVIRKLHAGLWANDRRHFAILAGLSGSGKTLLARAYGEAIAKLSGSEGGNLCTVPVQPGWYDPSSLLGYVNPLQSDSYIRTPFLEFLIKAAENAEQPFTVVLDEMNLSRPEQYLAPVLSAMETGEALTLHSSSGSFDGVPPTVPFPGNLAIIGTVNMDETTHGISDKVLDRAFTIEFWDVDLEKYPRWGDRKHSDKYEESARSLMTDLMHSLQPARLHFGWRVVDDVLDFMDRIVADDSNAAISVALDDVVYAKILPKMRGDDSPKFREALQSTRKVLEKHDMHNCVRKVKELSDDLDSTGSARFWR